MNKPSASFLRAKNARDALTPLMSVSSPVGTVACRTKATTCVSTANQHEGAPLQAPEADAALTDEDLEAEIVRLGNEYVEAMDRLEASNCFGDAGEACRIGSRLSQLIRRRVQRRGLAG